jgi:hypothetical protein
LMVCLLFLFLILPPPIFLEHQTFPDIEVKICFPPQNKCMICCDSLCPFPLQLIYNHGHTIWDKKMNWYWEHLNEHIGNLIGTQWEHFLKQKIPPPPPKKIQKKKKLHSLNLLIAGMKVLFWKQSATIFTL